MRISYSQEQENIFSLFDKESCNIMVNSSPGSGKTTMLEGFWARSKSQNILSLAFNKNIVEELERRLLPKVESRISTYNSLGARMCSFQWPKVKLNKEKVYKHIRSEVEHLLPDKEKNACIYSLKQLVGYMKNTPNCTELTHDEIGDIIAFYSLDSYEGIQGHAIRVLDASNSDTTQLDFADQLLFPLLYGLRFPYYEEVFVDEYQDTNGVQRSMLLGLLIRNKSLRLCLVGDSHQAIYGFRGSLSDSMHDGQHVFNCTPMPLTITRRCARSIVEEAQLIYPDDINYAPDAIQGIVRRSEPDIQDQYHIKPVYRDYSGLLDTEQFYQSDMVLCRTTAPLIAFAYMLLRNNIPCQVRGRDIGHGLIKYIEKSQQFYIADFLTYMEEDLGRQIEKARSLRHDDKVQALYDRQETLRIFAENIQTIYVSDMILYIMKLFDSGRGVVLSTVHKAKGLEARRVFILAPDLMPHPLATQAWEREQEANIQYVAITRAKEELVYI